MLKLEKKSRHGEINIAMRQPRRRWSKLLLQAFAFSLSWHLGAIFLFQVSGLKILDEESKLLATAVNAEIHQDSDEEEIVAQATFHEDEKILNFIQPPVPSLPSIPKIHFVPLSLSFQLDLSLHNHNPFEEIENEIQETYFPPLPKPKTSLPLSIHVSGLLANRLLPFEEFDLPPISLMSQRWVFTVNVYDPQGKIISYESQHPFDPREEPLIDQILSSLQFAPIQSHFITTGEIEIVLTSKEKQ